MLTLYTAGDLGFHEPGRQFMKGYVKTLGDLGFEVINPWELTTFAETLEYIGAKKLEELWGIVGSRNAEGIERSDAITACLDGWDTGTASEVGYAASLGKPVHGWLSDWRTYGELECRINVQLWYFVKKVPGSTFATSYEEHLENLKRFRDAA